MRSDAHGEWKGRVGRPARAVNRLRTLAAALVAAATVACGAAGDAGETPAEDAGGGSTPAETGAEAGSSSLDSLARALVPELERRSGLEARHPPRLARRSRAQLEAFLEDELAEQLPPEKAEALGATYSRLGLLPDTLQLDGLLRKLYMEQVVGYYDPEADTLFVLEDVPPAEARTVLVHELVHALQDQHLDLDSLTSSLREQNDASNAARAAIEGQATLVMAEWTLAETTGSDVDLTTMPGIAEKFGEIATEGAPESMPTFGSAPRIIRETLTFPYVGGLGYMQALWRETEGRPAPFGSRLPASTEQVIHPERALGPSPDAPTEVSFTSTPPDGWSQAYANSLGELETRVFLAVHLGDDSEARSAAAGWDGDRLRLVRSDGSEALLWASVWDEPAEAEEFASAARRALRARYGGEPGAAGRAVTVERLDAGGRPLVRIVDRPTEVDAGVLAPAAGVRLSGGGAGGGPAAGGP